MIRVRLKRAAPSALEAEAPAPAGFGSGEYAAVSLLRCCPPRIRAGRWREVANRTDRAPEAPAESSCALNVAAGFVAPPSPGPPAADRGPSRDNPALHPADTRPTMTGQADRAAAAAPERLRERGTGRGAPRSLSEKTRHGREKHRDRLTFRFERRLRRRNRFLGGGRFGRGAEPPSEFPRGGARCSTSTMRSEARDRRRPF